MSLSRSQQIIQDLHPLVARKALLLLAQCTRENIPVIFHQGLRTMEEQAALYAQGRTTAGQIVTNAKAGHSYHNYGLALDYALIDKDGCISWEVNAQWKRVAEIAKGLSFEWGGDWISFKDYPHLEMTFGLSISDLLAGKRPPSGGIVSGGSAGGDDNVKLYDSEIDFIVAVLGDYWFKMAGNKPVQDEAHRIADLLRAAKETK